GHDLAVAGALVVEGEGLRRGLLGPDPRITLLASNPGLRARGDARAPRRAVRGLEGVAGEGVEEVGEEELLVLLLVVEPELDQRVELGGALAREEVRHARVDVPAIGADLL